MKNSGFSRLAYFGLAALGGAFAAAAPALAPFSGWGKAWLLPAGFLLGLAAAFFAPRLSSFTNERAALGLALGATLLTGAAWLLLSRVSPVMDFSRMFATAAAFAENRPLPDPAYQAVFPHLLGYPFVLSLLFRVSGPSVAAAQIFNLFLSLCIAALLFSVGKKLLGVGCGLAAGLLWALMPSHFMLLSLVAGEPLHIALTLLAVRVYLQAAGAPPDSFRGSLPYWGLLGLTVALSSLVRPLGPVYLLAFALCALVFGKRRLTRLALSLLVMLAVYAAVTQAGTVLWEKALERPVARNGFGWNLYVGMNRVNAGGWNQPDQEVMSEKLREGLDAPAIQAFFAGEGLARLGGRAGDGTLLRFMAKKFTQLWCQDSFTVYWLATGARDDSPLDIPKHSSALSALCNLFYGVLLGCCALSLFRQIKTRSEAFVLPVTLLAGAVILFILLEANPRYHYAGSAALCLLAAGSCSAASQGG